MEMNGTVFFLILVTFIIYVIFLAIMVITELIL